MLAPPALRDAGTPSNEVGGAGTPFPCRHCGVPELIIEVIQRSACIRGPPLQRAPAITRILLGVVRPVPILTSSSTVRCIAEHDGGGEG
ncbi:hypothetical protein E5S69_29560 [Cupriavidus necator]|nr:hypothetical protein [Cupriavidus necator]